MGNEWEMGNVLYFFIEVDLWLILFFKGENSGRNGVCAGIRICYILRCTSAYSP